MIVNEWMSKRVKESDFGLVRCWPNIPICTCKNQEMYAKQHIQVSCFLFQYSMVSISLISSSMHRHTPTHTLYNVYTRCWRISMLVTMKPWIDCFESYSVRIPKNISNLYFALYSYFIFHKLPGANALLRWCPVIMQYKMLSNSVHVFSKINWTFFLTWNFRSHI